MSQLKSLLAAIIHSLFVSAVMASVALLFHISYMTANYSIIWVTGTAIFIALVWEFYFRYSGDEQPLDAILKYFP
jgi:hypothetical protein